MGEMRVNDSVDSCEKIPQFLHHYLLCAYLYLISIGYHVSPKPGGARMLDASPPAFSKCHPRGKVRNTYSSFHFIVLEFRKCVVRVFEN